MKRKVQAQRKFAQGAYIPPNTNNTNVTVDRKTDQTPQKDAQDQVNQNIIRTVTSASHLLDVVCFQKLHKHVDPIVLLERLKYSPPVAQAEPLQRRTIAKPALGVAKRLIRYLTSSKTFKNKYAMRLRSSGPIGSFKKDPQNQQEKAVSSRKSSTKGHRRFKNEDDRPLTYFTKRNKQGKPHARKDESSENVSNNDANDLLIPTTSQKEKIEVYLPYDSISSTADSSLASKSRRGRKKGRKRPSSAASSTDTSVYLPPRSYIARKRSQSGVTADEPVASTSALPQPKVGRPSRSANAKRLPSRFSNVSTPRPTRKRSPRPAATNSKNSTAKVKEECPTINSSSAQTSDRKASVPSDNPFHDAERRGKFYPEGEDDMTWEETLGATPSKKRKPPTAAVQEKNVHKKEIGKTRGRKRAQPVASNNAPACPTEENNEMVIEGVQEIEDYCAQIKILNPCSIGPPILLTSNNEWEESMPHMPAIPLPIISYIKKDQDLLEINDSTPLLSTSNNEWEESMPHMPAIPSSVPLTSVIERDAGVPQQMHNTTLPVPSSSRDKRTTLQKHTPAPVPLSSAIEQYEGTPQQMDALPLPGSSNIEDDEGIPEQMNAMPLPIPVLPMAKEENEDVQNEMLSMPCPQQLIAQAGPSGLQPVQVCASGFRSVSVFPPANICTPGNYPIQYAAPQHFETVQIPIQPEAQIHMAGNYAVQHMPPPGFITVPIQNLPGPSGIQYIQSANAQLYQTQDSYVAAYEVAPELPGPSHLQPCTMAISASNYPAQHEAPQNYEVMTVHGEPSRPAKYPTPTNSYNPQEPVVIPASNYPAQHESPQHYEVMSNHEEEDHEEPGPSGIKYQPSINSYNPQEIESEDTDAVIDSDGEDAGAAWSTFSGSSTTVYDCDADEDETTTGANELEDVIIIDPPQPCLYTVNEIEKRINESVKKASLAPWDRLRPMNYERQTKMVKVRGKWTYRKNYSEPSGVNVKPDVDSKSSIQVCPTQVYNLVADVVNAPSHDLQRRCRKCLGCYLVKKVLCLSYLFLVRIAHDILQQKQDGTSSAVGDDSNGSNMLLSDGTPSQRGNMENRNFTNTITSPNGETFEKFSAQTFYVDLIEPTNYLIEFNWNWVPSTKRYIITAGVTAKSQDHEITQLNLTSHIHIIKEVLTFMSNYFKERQIEPFTFLSETIFFANVKREATISDVVKRVVQGYEAFASQSTSTNPPLTPESLRKFIRSSFNYPEPRRKKVMPKLVQPCAAPSSAALSTRPSRARGPDRNSSFHGSYRNDTFRVPRQIRPTRITNPSSSAEGNFLCHPRERPKQPPSLGGKHGCNKQPHIIANLKKDGRKAPAKTVKKKRWSCKNAKAIGRLAASRREGALPRDQEEEGVTAKNQKKAPPKLKLHSDVPVAPIYHPTEEEFKDPITYFKKIMPEAATYGLCKVVAPEGFKPKCTLNNDMRFSVTNQYICRLFNRWGPATREMCAIKSYLASQSVYFLRSPLLEGVEVNLPKLYQIVQRLGGLKQVIEKKRWTKIAEEMRLTRTPKADKKIDKIYVKYVLPYDMLSHERLELMRVIETCWAARSKKMMDRAMNPLHRKKRLLGESDSSEDEEGSDSHVMDALAEAEDCFVNGRVMTLATFKKVGKKIIDTYFGRQKTPLDVIENSYWNLVLGGLDHLCVNTASIDTGEEGYGFPKNPRDPFGKHPWNLKVLSQNSGNVLRYLGPVLGVTVPTLHLGMLFSSSCWHRDPHGLPWIEYLHNGPSKVWYGIPESESANFRKVAEEECPTLCQNKLIWLPSDIAMIPPEVLLQHGVGLSRIVQQPGEFVLVLPRSYSCSVSTGYTESESVYFATDTWFASVHEVFHDLRESCEPTMFSLEKLLLAAAQDATVPLDQLCQVYQLLKNIIDEEIANRASLAALDVKCEYSQPHLRQRPSRTWNVREQEECEVCRSTLYLSRVRGLIEKSSVCPQHALLMFKARKVRCNYDSAEIEIFFKETELIDILKKVETRLATSECELATFGNQTISIAAEA